MALDLSQQSARAADATFRARVDAALVRELPGILTEATTTPGYAKRNALAQQLARSFGWDQHMPSFYRFMASQTRAIDALGDITEGDYTSAVAFVFDVVAGITAEA